MKIIEANLVFSKMSFQEDIDYDTCPQTIYECAVCKNKISLNMKNFKDYTLNAKSKMSEDANKEINELLKTENRKITNSFIDFHCPKCNTPTRIYFTAWAGGRYTAGYDIDYVVI